MKLSLFGTKNLLAFSAGIDSSALFFMMIEENIPFDIALVNYGTRAESDTEEAHAKKLAHRYNLTCHSTKAPKFDSHFEQQARAFRYNFLEALVDKYSYDTLITAHQLNDQLEWLLMRLTKGAGTSELVGLMPMIQRENYALIRPLLAYSKEELLEYLHTNNYPYFVDSSNSSEDHERNSFRKQYSDPLIIKYKEGIQNSFEYLRKDKVLLEAGFETLLQEKSLRIIQLKKEELKAKAVDVTLKELGYLLSASQRREVEKGESLVIGGTWAIEHQDNLLYIAPYSTLAMPKPFKEQCRKLGIPSKIRPYLHQEEIDLNYLFSLQRG